MCGFLPPSDGFHNTHVLLAVIFNIHPEASRNYVVGTIPFAIGEVPVCGYWCYFQSQQMTAKERVEDNLRQLGLQATTYT